jgi:hypothetical protein
MKLEPKICGKWDGSGLWLQWKQAAVTGTTFELQVRYRRDAGGVLGPWITTVPPQGPLSHWGVIPTWKEGWQVQVRAAGEAAWENAAEVTLTRWWTLFEMSSAKYDQHFVAGSIFHAQLDAAACAYQSKEEIFAKAGETIQVRHYAMGSSGHFQLDHEKIRALLDLGARYGFGRTDIKQVADVAGSIDYLCKYLSKRRPPCLKRARLWQALGGIERTRVKAIVVDSEYSRILRRVMGKRSVKDELNGIEAPPLKGIPYNGKRFGFERDFIRARQKASLAYMLTFDPEFAKRKAIWDKVRGAGLCRLSHEWLGWHSGMQEVEEQQ